MFCLSPASNKVYVVCLCLGSCQLGEKNSTNCWVLQYVPSLLSNVSWLMLETLTSASWHSNLTFSSEHWQRDLIQQTVNHFRGQKTWMQQKGGCRFWRLNVINISFYSKTMTTGWFQNLNSHDNHSVAVLKDCKRLFVCRPLSIKSDQTTPTHSSRSSSDNFCVTCETNYIFIV